MRTLSRLISVDLRRAAYLDIVCHELDDMLRELPDAEIIRVELRAPDEGEA